MTIGLQGTQLGVSCIYIKTELSYPAGNNRKCSENQARYFRSEEEGLYTVRAVMSPRAPSARTMDGEEL